MMIFEKAVPQRRDVCGLQGEVGRETESEAQGYCPQGQVKLRAMEVIRFAGTIRSQRARCWILLWRHPGLMRLGCMLDILSPRRSLSTHTPACALASRFHPTFHSAVPQASSWLQPQWKVLFPSSLTGPLVTYGASCTQHCAEGPGSLLGPSSTLHQGTRHLPMRPLALPSVTELGLGCLLSLPGQMPCTFSFPSWEEAVTALPLVTAEFLFAQVPCLGIPDSVCYAFCV